MKKTFLIAVLAAAFLVPAGRVLAAFEKADDAMKSAQQKNQKKDYAGARQDAAEAFVLAQAPSAKMAACRLIAGAWLSEKPGSTNAFAEFEKALALPGIQLKDRALILTDMAKAHQNQDAWDAAIADYQRMLADPEADNKLRIAALNGIAGNQVDKWQLKEAGETIRKALALPDLKPDEQLAALGNVGALEMRQGNYAAARDVYAKMLEADSGDANKEKVDRLMTAAWLAEGNFDKAIEINSKPGRGTELAGIYQKQDKPEAARAEFRKILDQATNKPSIVAFGQLLRISRENLDYATARIDAEKYLPAQTAVDPNRAGELFGLLKDSMEKGNYAFANWAAPIVMAVTNLQTRDYTLTRVYRINALCMSGKGEEARPVAEAAAADAKLAVPDRLRFRLTTTALGSTGKPGEMKTALDQAFATVKPDELAAKDKAAIILNAGKAALMSGKETAARELYGLYEGLLAKADRRSYVCEFMDQAPTDPGSWLASPLLKNPGKMAKMDRKVSMENLEELLATDAVTANRGVSAEGKAGESAETKTDFCIVCDADGIRFFFLAADPKVGEVTRGFASGGSYEGYLAAGPGQPYYTFLVDLGAGTLSDEFRTMYPNRYFRIARAEDKTVQSLTTPTDKGFATTLFYPWTLFYDRLPQNGDTWQFDNIRWTRADGYSWAGSQSVHNRSSWGDIVFGGMTEKARREIKRRLVCKAYAKYKLESNYGARGDIVHWKDPELGDPAFFNAALAPLVDRLDRLGKLVSKDMTDADVDQLFDQAVPDWMEFKYRAAELRTAWLSDKNFTAP